MKEFKGNIWEFPADVLLIHTNGFVKNNGCAVMGAGIAKQAKDKYPGLDKHLGAKLTEFGSKIHRLLRNGDCEIWSFPTKDFWYNPSSLEIIRASAHNLASIIHQEQMENYIFAMTRPGCGNGKLNWEDVKPILEEEFAGLDNIYIVDTE